MARNKVLEREIWKAARTNAKLDNSIYKAWSKYYRDRNKLYINEYRGKTTIAGLKEAYHSPQTKPEIRAMMLQNMFTPAVTIKKHLAELLNIDDTNIFFVIDRWKGQPYIRLVNAADWSSVKIPPRYKEHLKYYRPMNPQSPKLLDMLHRGSPKQQKIAMWVGELNSCLFAIADMIITCITMHDPLQRYISGNKRNKNQSYDDSPIEGDKQYHLDIYIRNITHIKEEFDKYIPIATKLGIDTTTAKTAIDTLLDTAIAYKNMPSGIDEYRELYKLHEMGVQTVQVIYELAQKVDNIDYNDDKIDKIASNSAIPKFVTYNPDKILFHKTGVSKGASAGIVKNARRITKVNILA